MKKDHPATRGFWTEMKIHDLCPGHYWKWVMKAIHRQIKSQIRIQTMPNPLKPNFPCMVEPTPMIKFDDFKPDFPPKFPDLQGIMSMVNKTKNG
mgnify:CR=1 FL=1